MQIIQFEIPGQPVAQGRPRASTRGGFVKMYDPPESKRYKQHVRSAAIPYAPKEPLEGPLEVRMTFYRRTLKSFTKKEEREAADGILRPTTRPDSSNYIKGVEDALNGLMWKDDSQIVTLIAEKYYSDEPRVFVEIIEL